jgi:hypothetical protein
VDSQGIIIWLFYNSFLLISFSIMTTEHVRD